MRSIGGLKLAIGPQLLLRLSITNCEVVGKLWVSAASVFHTIVLSHEYYDGRLLLLQR
jgi:hypothetical protein